MCYSVSYDAYGDPLNFLISGDRLILKNTTGSTINTLKILEYTGDKLVLVSAAANGDLDDPWALKYTMFKEELIQKNMPLRADDIFKIHGQDTIYKSGQKIYAQFKGPSFRRYIYDQPGIKKFKIRSGQLISNFVINSDGLPDSVRIIKGINPKFDAEFIKAFNSAQRMWIPAHLNGKAVDVLMNLKLEYLTSDQAIPSYVSTQSANAAYHNKYYEQAIYYYDEAIQAKGDDAENFYRRGVCKQKLGNLLGACEDWKIVQSLGSQLADEVLLKYCK